MGWNPIAHHRAMKQIKAVWKIDDKLGTVYYSIANRVPYIDGAGNGKDVYGMINLDTSTKDGPVFNFKYDNVFK